MPCGPDETKWEEVLLQVRLLDVSADYLAKTKLVPTAQSTSATHFCPHCNFNRNAAKAKGPFSFLAGTCPCNGHTPEPTGELQPDWRLRDLASTLTCLEHAFRINDKKKRAKFLHSKGLRADHPHVRRHGCFGARANCPPLTVPQPQRPSALASGIIRPPPEADARSRFY